MVFIKTFEGIKSEIYQDCINSIYIIEEQIKHSKLSPEELEELREDIKECELYIDNLGQVARQKISRNVRNLMLALQDTCMDISYLSNFIQYIRLYSGKDYQDGFMEGEYPLQQPMINLGLDIEDMKFFMKKDPREDKVYDEFTELINSRLGTEIPTRKELRDAKKKREEDPTEENIKRHEELKIRDGHVPTDEKYIIYSHFGSR